MVEGQEPVVVSEGQQSGFGEREGAKGGDGRVDQGAEHTGGGGLAAARRPLKNEDGVGTQEAAGGQEQGEAAEPVLGTGKIEK